MSKRVKGFLVVVITTGILYFFTPYFERLIEPKGGTSLSEELPTDSLIVAPLPEPKRLYGLVIDSMLVIEDKIKRNQNISEILSAYNINSESIYKLAKASKEVFDVRKLAANKKYTLICSKDSLKTAKAMIYEHNPIEYVVFNLFDSITVEKKTKEIEIVEREVSGIIESSLALTMDELGLSFLTNDFADVFAWQIDFFRLQKGDRFKVIFEEQMVEGKSVGIGNIKAAQFNHFGNDYFAFHYDQGNGPGYFDEKGNSLQKALLKYPLKFDRISSRYSGRRYHPVQKRYKAHLGTDFAAPRGTPIRSVGDGVIIEARFAKYNGNYVKIRHNSTYTTQYLHMSKIASGIKPGTRVRQGEVIGLVGSTGLATGNHLCYRFWKNGVQINALKVELPPSEPIEEANRPGFEMIRNKFNDQLNKIEFPADPATILARSN